MIAQENYTLPLSGSAGGVPIVVGAAPVPVHVAGPANTVDYLDLLFVNSDILAADVVIDIAGTSITLAVQAKASERVKITLDGSGTPPLMQASSAGADMKALGSVERASPRVA